MIDGKDGKAYKCIVRRAEEQRVYIHWHGWNRRFDEWISLDDKRLLSRNSCNGSSLSEEPPLDSQNQSTRSADERFIDAMFDSLQPTPPVESVRSPGAAGSTNGANPHGGSKRTRDSRSDVSADENTPKRPLLNTSGSTTDTSISSAGATSSTPLQSGGPQNSDGHLRDVTRTSLGGEIPHPPAPSPPAALSTANVASGGWPDTAMPVEREDEREGGSSSVIGPSRRAEITAQHSAIHPPLSVPEVQVSSLSPQVEEMRAVQRCALCNVQLSGRSVSCGGCGSCFHPEPLCLGVGESIVAALLEGGDAISYRCCRCRGGGDVGSVGRDSGAVGQIMGIIGSLVSQVRDLAATVAALQGNRAVSNPSPVTEGPAQASQSPIVGSSVMSEVREIYEREKRKTSVILRGLGGATQGEVVEKFSQMCIYLNVGNILLTDIVPVASGVWRGKILDSHKRQLILADAKKLRHSENFSRIYIQRDLTFRQRRELIEKRVQRRVTGANAIDVRGGPSSGGGGGAALVGGGPGGDSGVGRGESFAAVARGGGGGPRGRPLSRQGRPPSRRGRPPSSRGRPRGSSFSSNQLRRNF